MAACLSLEKTEVALRSGRSCRRHQDQAVGQPLLSWNESRDYRAVLKEARPAAEPQVDQPCV